MSRCTCARPSPRRLPPPSGPDDVPAVYVHGLSGSATNWTDLAALLSTRAAGTAVDLPGFGLSRPLASRDYTPAAHADALLCFLAGRGRPVHLLGNSLGGAVALSRRRPASRAGAHAHPRLAGHAGPAARPAARLRPEDAALAAAAGRQAGQGGAGRDERPHSRRAGREAVLRRPEPRAGAPAGRGTAEYEARAAQEWAREAAERTGKAMVAGWLRGESLWSVAARVRTPTLVMWGDRDRLVAPRLARTDRGRAAERPAADAARVWATSHRSRPPTPSRALSQVCGTRWPRGAGKIRREERVPEVSLTPIRGAR